MYPPLVVSFPPHLPISARTDDIRAAIEGHSVVIVAGATGSGKTTQLPKIALAMGRGTAGLIGVTQPRRIAATSVAARVAGELGTTLGAGVGYQIRFEDKTSRATRVKFMTDGILLAEIQGDRDLLRYDTLIIDEAHERSLTIDFLLGWLAQLVRRRPDLKVIVSSATIETERFGEFFGGAPIIAVEGRTYPVDVLYAPPGEDDDIAVAVANAVEEVVGLDPHGDVLAFLPGEREIRDAENELRGRNLRGAVVQPLYGRLSGSEQASVFVDIPQRRIVLATNVAETSITIPGIVYVVDTGVARLSRYEPRSGTTRLQIEAISQASAEQRKGRCGRVRPGVCLRLYDEDSFLGRPAFTDPEIKRSGLAGVILRMKALGLGDVESFPFLDPPPPRAIAEGYRVLEELGAIDEERELTPLGHRLSRFPVDPRLSRMILAGAELDCLRDVLVVTAALTCQDPRERPRDAQQKADELHRRFRDEHSDFVGLLRLWDFVKEAERKGSSNLRRTCRDNFLSFMRVREWGEVHRQFEDLARELRPVRGRAGGADPLHRALATGLLSKIGEWSPEKRVYAGAKQTRFLLHPSSALAKKPPPWVMAFELVETTQLFARTAAKVDPDWLLEAGAHLLKRSYSDPHWSERAGRASVKETSTLFGLTIARDRPVDYASISPRGARRIFIDHALVRGEYTSRGAFQTKNRAIFDEAAHIRDRARRGGLLDDDTAVFAFFEARVPSDVVNGKTFEDWREVAERAEPTLLHLSIEDLFTGGDLDPADYPDFVTLHGVKLPVAYRFDPASDNDGITLTVPLVLVAQLDPGELDWTIPGRHREKIEALLHELPKPVRRQLGPIDVLADAVAPALTPFRGALVPALARAVLERTGVDVPDSAFRPDAVAAYLRLTCVLVDAKGKTVAQGRDVRELLRRYGAEAKSAWQAAPAAEAWDRKGLTAWDFPELPPVVVRRVGGVDLRGFPTLVDRGASVDLALLESSALAEAALRGGVRRLVRLAAQQSLAAAARVLPGAFQRPSAPFVRSADDEAFKAALLTRLVDVAFGLSGDAPLPRNRAAFERVVADGTPRLQPLAARFAGAIDATRPEVAKILASLPAFDRHPGARAALTDVRAQLDRLLAVDLMTCATPDHLAQFPRYFRAALVRLDRAVANPKKDIEKLAPFTPIWTGYLARRATVRDPREAFEVHIELEELRVAIFAPELKAAIPVSIKSVAEAVDTLT